MQMEFYFSYTQEVYDEITEGARRYLRWKNRERTWTYKNCQVSIIGMAGNHARLVLRRINSKYSSFMKAKYEVNLMMGFVTQKFSEPKEKEGKWIIEFETEPNNDKDLREIKDVKIWSENKDDVNVLHSSIREKIGKPPNKVNVFEIDVKNDDRVIPVIYQPRIDAWKNFLREVHVCKKSKNQYEVTLVFNDENLRKHGMFDVLYRIFRFFRYKRTKDIETFYINLGEGKDSFTFPGIYSGENTIYHDSIHGDKKENGSVPERKIKYYFQDKNHPIVFINTSNHAMAQHDNNHDFWKWEYIPWIDKVPIKIGTKSKKEVLQEQQEF